MSKNLIDRDAKFIPRIEKIRFFPVAPIGGNVIQMKIRLFYTGIPFWRAEVSRLALYIGNIDFEDMRMTWREDFDTMIETGKLPYWCNISFQTNASHGSRRTSSRSNRRYFQVLRQAKWIVSKE